MTPHHLDGAGLACIHLTPRIKRRIDELDAGDRLFVDTDDPAAREGVPSWCRLTRHELIDTVEHDPTTTTFTIQKRADT